MRQSDVPIDPEDIKRIRKRVLEEEKSQLHYKRPPSINNDIENVICEEIKEISLSDD